MCDGVDSSRISILLVVMDLLMVSGSRQSAGLAVVEDGAIQNLKEMYWTVSEREAKYRGRVPRFGGPS